ncbi:MAG: FIST signal transduction protein [Haloarculaceae archaeon]
METQFVDDTGPGLIEAVRSMASAPSVRGVLVVAADGNLPETEALNPVLMDLPAPVFGGVFPEILHEGEKYDTGAVVTGLTVEPDVTVVPDLSDPGTEFGATLPGSVSAGETAFVLVDAYATRVEEFVSSLFAAYGVDLNYVGGGAGSLDEEGRPCLFTNEGLVADAGVFATVDTPTSVGVRHGWEEIAGPLRVTDAEGPTLSRLNGEPAFEVYRRIVEEDAGVTIDPENFFEVAKSYPFGLSRLDGEKIVRDPFEVTDDGGLACFGTVPEGAFVHILRGDRDSLVDAAGTAYEDATGTGASDRAGGDGEVLFFDCISRVLYLEDAFTEELAAVGGDRSPRIGALTIGEIANDGEGHLDYYNKTAVAAVTGEL